MRCMGFDDDGLSLFEQHTVHKDSAKYRLYECCHVVDLKPQSVQ